MKKQFIIIPAIALMSVTAFAGYTTYAAEMRGRLPELTDEQRQAIETIRELRQSGDFEGAQKLAEETGLPERPMMSRGKQGRGLHSEEMQQHRQKMDKIFESVDYQSFLDEVEGTPMEDLIDTEEKFNTLVEAHNLREEGDFDGAHDLMESLGLKRPHKPMINQN